jgi:hypothetical protein
MYAVYVLAQAELSWSEGDNIRRYFSLEQVG